MTSARKWEDWMTLLLGAWLIIAPFALNLSGIARTSFFWFGGAIILMSIWAMLRSTSRAPEWLDLLIGVALFVSPWVLGFADQSTASWNAWIVGGLVALLSGIAIPDAARLENERTVSMR